MKDYNQIAEKNLLEMAKKKKYKIKNDVLRNSHWIYVKCNIF